MALFAAGVLSAQEPSGTKKSPSKPTPHKSTKKRTSARSKTAARTPATPAKTASRKKSASKSKKTVASRRSTQQQPTTERYKEIQQALAEHGYFNGNVDGNWGPDSVDALKRFQREQNLTEDGKLGSLSLIALGLGPKRAEPAEKATQQ